MMETATLLNPLLWAQATFGKVSLGDRSAHTSCGRHSARHGDRAWSIAAQTDA